MKFTISKEEIREKLKNYKDKEFPLKLFFQIPYVPRSRKWMLQQLQLSYVHALPFTGDNELDKYWFMFIVGELRFAHKLKKRKLAKFKREAVNRYFSMVEYLLKNFPGKELVVLHTLGNIVGNKDYPFTMNEFGRLLERTRFCIYRVHDEFKQKVDLPSYNQYQLRYWIDLRDMSASILNAINVKREKEDGKGKEEQRNDQ